MNEVFKALTADDIKAISYYVNNYATGSQTDGEGEGRQASIEQLLTPWSEEKQDLFELFGKKLILTKDYEYKESVDELERVIARSGEFNSFRDTLNRHFRNCAKLQLVSEIKNPNDFLYYDVKTIGKPGYEKKYALLGHSLNVTPWELASNRANSHYQFLYGDKIFDFPEGTKYIKILGKLCNILGLNQEFEDFRLWHSLTLNNKILHGDLCISIHPLDYMTMSDNDSGWESCMSWKNNGCYRMGTVEMMNSPMVVVAYLSASNKMKLNWDGSLSWNNKKWRNLFVIDQDVITEVKPYPYRNDEMTDAVLAWLNELIGKKYSDEIYNFEEGRNLYANMYRIHAETNYMYNDFGSCQHRAVIKLPIPNKIEGKIRAWHFNYSGPAECMWCGSIDSGFSSDSLYCDECDAGNALYCEICGSRIHGDDYFYDEDREIYVCYSCEEDYYVEDQLRGNQVHCDDTADIYYASRRDNPDEDDDFIVTNRWEVDNNSLIRVAWEEDRYGRRHPRYYVNLDECDYRWLNINFYDDESIRNYVKILNKDGVETGYEDKTFVSVSSDNRFSWYEPNKPVRRVPFFV